MPSKAEQVCGLIASVLSANAPSLGVQAVYRDRDDALTREETPVILVELLDEDSRRLGSDGGQQDLDEDLLRLQVCVCVRGANWQTVADDVRVNAHTLLVADPAIRALLSSSLRRDTAQWNSRSTDVPFGFCNQIYQAKYITNNTGIDQ
ncbi:MAG: hypothetical protein ACRCV9_16400 [Burkholderiaceae bacterium]